MKKVDPIWIVAAGLALVLLLWFGGSCESDEQLSVRLGRSAYEAMFQKVLKDPSSFVLYEERYSVDGDGSTVHWVLDTGARNGFGGMVRKTYRLRTSRYSSDVYNENEEDDSFSYFRASSGEFY